MNKLLIIILAVAVIAAGAFFFMKNKSSAPIDEASASVKSATEATSSDAALDQLEQENDNENFSDVNADFGAQVNAAAQ